MKGVSRGKEGKRERGERNVDIYGEGRGKDGNHCLIGAFKLV